MDILLSSPETQRRTKMRCSETRKKMTDRMRTSMMFRTFARIFENGFGAPLYFVSGSYSEFSRTPDNESAFCLAVNPKGCCVGCPQNKLPYPSKLEPWTWTRPCHAGLQVTMVPVMDGKDPVGWLVTGHIEVDDETETLNGGMGSPEITRIDNERYLLLVSFLQTCAGILGANSISFLIGRQESAGDLIGRGEAWDIDGDNGEIESQESVSDFREQTGLEPIQYVTLCGLERARSRFLRGSGKIAEILSAGKAAGWPDGNDFLETFQSHFGELPTAYRDKILKLWRTFSEAVSRI